MSKSEQWTQTALRLPDAFLVRLDKLAERLSQPGLRVTRAEAHRLALYRGVDQLETNLDAEKKKR